MLSRSHRTNNLNQENQHQAFRAPIGGAAPFKTPARPSTVLAGKGLHSAAPITTTVRNNRILGAKDRNGGVATNRGKESHVLVTDASSCKAGPSQTKQSTQSNLLSPRPSVQLPDYLRTPSPGVHRYANFSFSPEADVEVEIEVELSREELDLDRDVELAGASAKDFEEAFDPGFYVPDYSRDNIGNVMRGIVPSTINSDFESYVSESEDDIRSFKAHLEEHQNSVVALGPSAEPVFPLPRLSQASSIKSTNERSGKVSRQVEVGAVFSHESTRTTHLTSSTGRPPAKATEEKGDNSSTTISTSGEKAFAYRRSSAKQPGAASANSRSSSSTGGVESARLSKGVSAASRSRSGTPTTSIGRPNLAPSRAKIGTVTGVVKRPAQQLIALNTAEADLDAFGIIAEDPLIFEDETNAEEFDGMSFRFQIDP